MASIGTLTRREYVSGLEQSILLSYDIQSGPTWIVPAAAASLELASWDSPAA